MKKHRRKVDIGGRIFMTLCLLTILPFFIIPGILDLPNALTDNYKTAIVEVANWSHSSPDSIKKRDLLVINLNTNKELNIDVYYTVVNKGDVFEIRYLPYTKLATITRKIDQKKEQ
jgi:hypothetical protein